VEVVGMVNLYLKSLQRAELATLFPRFKAQSLNSRLC
jgi:hypothetical protein